MRHGKAALAALLVGMILFLNAVEVCPSLHILIHRDADKSGHECAVTMFAHGKVESASVDVHVLVATILIEATARMESSIFSTALEHLPQGRAPPALSTVS